MEARIRRSILSGSASPPPSLPLARRAILAASLSPCAQSVISGLPENSQEIAAMVSACRAFGADIVYDRGVADIFGIEALVFPKQVDCGQSSQALRLLLPLASLLDSQTTFAGNGGRVSILPILAYFESLGAECGSEGDFLPVKIKGPVEETELVCPWRIGSGIVSGLLLALPLRGVDSELGLDGSFTGAEHIDATISLLSRCGMAVERPIEEIIHIEGGQEYSPLKDFEVPKSAYLSSFPLLAGALCGKVTAAGSKADSRLIALMESFGAGFSAGEKSSSASAGALSATDVDCLQAGIYMPHAVLLASLADGTSVFSNYGKLRGVVGARARLLIRELGKMGIRTEENEESLRIEGGDLSGAALDPSGDAAVAMLLSLAALCARGESTLAGAECVDKGYPGFLRSLASLGALIR